MASHEGPVPPGMSGGTREEQFLTALQGVGGEGIRTSGPAAAVEAVLRRLKQRGVTEVVAWADPLLEALGLPQAAARRGIDWYTASPDRDPGEIRARAARAGAGITGADWAVAETGSLVLMSGPGRPRSASLLPPLHIAVLQEDRLVATTAELFGILAARAQSQGMPSSLNWVTGPSRTADIEHILVRKVHGPGELLVVLTAGL